MSPRLHASIIILSETLACGTSVDLLLLLLLLPLLLLLLLLPLLLSLLLLPLLLAPMRSAVRTGISAGS
jgi:hypothetical protein